MPDRYSIRYEDNGTAHVLGPEGWDDDLAEAAREALADLSKSSEHGKYSLQLERFLSFEFEDGERCDALLDEDIATARARFEKFLESLGCTVGPARGRRDKSRSVKRSDGNTGDIQIAIRVTRDFYDALRTNGLYTDWNPLEVNGWEQGSAARVAAGNTGKNEQGHIGDDSGNHFRIANRDWYPPLPHDPVGLGRRVLAAVNADLAAGHEWPPGAVLLVRALVDGGGRFEDTHVLTAADWAVGSRFGRAMIAPDKGTNGVRDKVVVISEEHRQNLADSFDRRHKADSSIPSMAALRELLGEGKLDELMRHPLYPNAQGKKLTGSNFRSDWFRPCMIRHKVYVESTRGQKLAAPHWLRRANVTAQVARTFGAGGTVDEIRERLKELEEDFGWKSSMLERYAANFFLTIRLEKRIATMDAMNLTEEVRPRLTTMNRSDTASDLLSPAIRGLHGSLPR